MAERPDPFEIEGVRRGQKTSSFPLATVALLLACLALGALILTSFPEKVRRKLGLSKPPEPVIKTIKVKGDTEYVEKIVEVTRDPKIKYYTPKKGMSVAKTSQGFDFKTEVKEEQGKLATTERVKAGSYEARYTLTVQRPRSADSLTELETATPGLAKILPDLEKMIPTARVSPFYKTLYQNKAKRLKDKADQLDRLLTKHNYYDCQTMLEMQHPTSGRKIFLLQGDMDVVADGSDGDRLATMPEKIVNSPHYQPFTSYGWDKVGTGENPMIAGWRKRITNAEQELRQAGTSSSRKTWLKDRIGYLKGGIADMKKRSFLIAEYDPFIVIPVYIIQDRQSAWGPNVGDYVAVIYQGVVYPAIVGDGGPSFKVGEASLRMARTINKNASPYHRPVSSVGVTYIVFPRSSEEKWAQPDYELWRAKTAELLNEIGGLGQGYSLYQWENLLPE